MYYFSCKYSWLCSCRLHCCWQMKHLLRGYEHILKQVNSTDPELCFAANCVIIIISAVLSLPALRSAWLFCAAYFVSCHSGSFCVLCIAHGIILVLTVSHQARLTHKQRKNIFHCLINIAWKMSLFVMWPLRVIWMRLIFHPGLQSSLFSQPLSYH